jgi:hypothetical protein
MGIMRSGRYEPRASGAAAVAQTYRPALAHSPQSLAYNGSLTGSHSDPIITGLEDWFPCHKLVDRVSYIDARQSS